MSAIVRFTPVCYFQLEARLVSGADSQPKSKYRVACSPSQQAIYSVSGSVCQSCWQKCVRPRDVTCITADAAQGSNIRSDRVRGHPAIGEGSYQTKMQLPPLDIFSKILSCFYVAPHIFHHNLTMVISL